MIGRRGVVLLVEDNEADAFLFRRAAAKNADALLIRVAADGQEAISYIEGVGPHANRHSYPVPSLVLLDLQLPRRSGFEVLERIRVHHSPSSLPVVILSTSALPTEVGKAFALGTNYYLRKPMSQKGMKEIVVALGRWWVDPAGDLGQYMEGLPTRVPAP